MTTYDVKIAGSGSVIGEVVEADTIRIIDGLLEFWLNGYCIFFVGANRLISARPR